MDLLKPLIALLAIVNPIGVVPFFIHFTQAFSREQRDQGLEQVHGAMVDRVSTRYRLSLAARPTLRRRPSPDI